MHMAPVQWTQCRNISATLPCCHKVVGVLVANPPRTSPKATPFHMQMPQFTGASNTTNENLLTNHCIWCNSLRPENSPTANVGLTWVIAITANTIICDRTKASQTTEGEDDRIDDLVAVSVIYRVTGRREYYLCTYTWCQVNNTAGS